MIEKQIKAWVIKHNRIKDNPDDMDYLFCDETPIGGAMFCNDKMPVYFTTKKAAQDYLKSQLKKKDRGSFVIQSVMLRKHKPLTIAESNFLSCVILLDQHHIDHDFEIEAEEIRERNYQWFSDLVMRRALK